MISPADAPRLPFLTGDAAGAHEITIGGEPWTGDARELGFEFQEQAGGSRLTFRSRRPMTGLTGETVVLKLGYGSQLVPYFVGELTRPMPDTPSFSDTAVALGPFNAMVEDSFTEQVTYRNENIRRVLMDIAIRAFNNRSRIQIEGGFNRTVEEHIFSEEVSLMEGALAITGPAGFIQTDLPGGGRLFAPAPKPGATGKAKVVLGPDDYESFKPDTQHATNYSKVVVFRRGSEEGEYEVRETALVPQPLKGKPARKNRVYYIPEFVGTALEAKQAAYDMARRLASGEVRWTMDGVAIDVELKRYDQVQGVREVERADGWYRETYDLTIDEGLSGAIDEWTMQLAGLGVLRSAEKIGPATLELPVRLSKAVIRTPRPDEVTEPYGFDGVGFWVTESSGDYFGWDEGGFWIDPAASNGKTGIDENGWWVDEEGGS